MNIFANIIALLWAHKETLVILIPQAKKFILLQKDKNIENWKKKNEVYALLRETALKVLGGKVSEHVIDIVFGIAFKELKDAKQI